MPTYEIQCEYCLNVFEHDCKYKDLVNVKCPMCESTKKKLLISKTSFILKGSCWAKDNYASNKK